MLRLIAGFDYPSEGEILLHGQNIARLPPYKRPVNTVFQAYALFPHMTVAENIAFGLEMLGKGKGEVKARVSDMLRLVRMEDLSHRRTSEISGGQQQRVALARALAPQPKLLLLDEPLSALDYKLRKGMQIELKRLQNETGITFIFVTHDQEEALAMSDRIAVMSAGKILQVGTPRDIYDRPAQRFVADFIGESNFLETEVIRLESGRAMLQLSSGAEICASVADGWTASRHATIMVRPEHARVVPVGNGATLTGVVETIVYLGTDTHFHLRIDDGTVFVVRKQNGFDEPAGLTLGQRAGVMINTNAAQLLRS